MCGRTLELWGRETHLHSIEKSYKSIAWKGFGKIRGLSRSRTSDWLEVELV
jgi:hypothetical protein